MCQLYPYFSLGKSRSHLRQGGVPCVGSSRFTRWRRRDTADSIEIIVVDETKCKYEEEEEKEEKQRIRASCISKCYAFENQPFRRFLLLSLSLYFCLFPFFCLTFFNIYLSTYYVRARFFHDSIILTSTMKPTISPCREKIFEKNLPILISFFFFFDPSEK